MQRIFTNYKNLDHGEVQAYQWKYNNYYNDNFHITLSYKQLRINDDFWLEVGNVNHEDISYKKYLYYILILKLLRKRPICMIKQ
jgi:hypothetical protein